MNNSFLETKGNDIEINGKFATMTLFLNVGNMDIHTDHSSAAYQIKFYEPGKIGVNESTYSSSIIIRPHRLEMWEPTSLSNVEAKHFDDLIKDKPSILIIGTGSQPLIPSMALLRPLFEQGIGVEFMDSKAACYTYTILASEGRNVAACILIQ